VNKVILHGRLGSDPELRQTPNGTAVAKFSLAVPDKLYPKDREKTYWAYIVAWKKTAEICAKYLTKGSEVIIEGRLTRSSWTKDGVKHSRDEIVAESMEFCGAGKKQAAEEEPDDLPF